MMTRKTDSNDDKLSREAIILGLQNVIATGERFSATADNDLFQQAWQMLWNDELIIIAAEALSDARR